MLHRFQYYSLDDRDPIAGDFLLSIPFLLKFS